MAAALIFCLQYLSVGGDLKSPDLLRNIRILSPNKGALRERKGHSDEKTPIFEVFHKVLDDK